ncbi:MAG TPA: pyruvate formate lyase family protein [Spirochaetota bacterium]|nr:pyruvate formate lyase family protein [Spirochaetota bacterium]HPC42390.1 pyruvate formate lyase family protein [Spirochaetota bacterium]HPL17812.1 pyruvate formate lyase family protein [Spirochaetota bacterium]HQF08021.1 pyruvate formate lyase family protein [Spirochaetota bacterium]HQH96581.1 pyruvate formate lyase family protein [Spirochaetota bacterium]
MNFTNILVRFLLRLMAVIYNRRPSKNAYLICADGWINFTIGVRTEDSCVRAAIRFRDGTVSVMKNIPGDADSVLVFRDGPSIREAINLPPNEMVLFLIKGRLRIEGNFVYPNIFNYLISNLLHDRHKKMQDKMIREHRRQKLADSLQGDLKPAPAEKKVREGMLKATVRDPGVEYLEDQFLPEYSLADFPRLKKFLDIHFTAKPEICHERPQLMTRWFRENGFEKKKDGTDWSPELRQAHAYRYLMENRKPIIRKDDLVAGTSTTKEIGVILYPDAVATMIWSELGNVADRELNSYAISEESRRVLHGEVFPFWTGRNFREWVRKEYGNPLCQRIDERFAVYFLWKTVALSHTIADFPKLLRIGTRGCIEEIRRELAKTSETGKRNLLEAMILCLEGLAAYAKNLSMQAGRDAGDEPDMARKRELLRIAEICRKVPEGPCTTLDEAVNAAWIGWVGLHMENTNAGLSLGRMDQWFQPYFKADMEKCATQEERDACIKKAIELVGCFYLRCTDHLPLVPDIGNYLFGGSSSDQAITLGGVTPDGEDAVCDMTYIFLKVTEMLSIRDPNVNARFNREKNSEAYLKRLCEVNLMTAATPSLHSDSAVMASLEEFNYDPRDLRNWSATGCVEPTLSGKHIGHTNCMMMNMVAALEMALNNGRHPLMDWKVGPETGVIESGSFATFEEFYDAFAKQFRFLIDNSVEYNNMLGRAHAYLRPTPLLSALIDGPVRKGVDVTKGGATYNSSGAACIGLADVTDSLMAVKKLVYDEKRVTLPEFKKAIDADYAGHPQLHAMVMNRVPRFGSGSDEALALAQRVAGFAHDAYYAHENYRGGRYTAGFWSMSNHVIFGNMTGALPSGRLAGKAFTPGLTPEPNASRNLLDNIRDVARLDPKTMNNNIAFNVKVVPSASETHEAMVNTMYSYVKTYFELGGMQMQMNVVSSAVLRDAMAHPENYRNLIVRISGYNAYFVTLNREMQIELIERAEYGV